MHTVSERDLLVGSQIIVIQSKERDFNQYGLYHESTHILPSSASCINLIITNQPNMVINSGVHPAFH